MAWDIYGNNLREGFCEVHPHVNQYYPCWICCDEIQIEEERQRDNDLQQSDYHKAMEEQHYKEMEENHSIFLQAKYCRLSVKFNNTF